VETEGGNDSTSDGCIDVIGSAFNNDDDDDESAAVSPLLSLLVVLLVAVTLESGLFSLSSCRCCRRRCRCCLVRDPFISSLPSFITSLESRIFLVSNGSFNDGNDDDGNDDDDEEEGVLVSNADGTLRLRLRVDGPRVDDDDAAVDGMLTTFNSKRRLQYSKYTCTRS